MSQHLQRAMTLVERYTRYTEEAIARKNVTEAERQLENLRKAVADLPDGSDVRVEQEALFASWTSRVTLLDLQTKNRSLVGQLERELKSTRGTVERAGTSMTASSLEPYLKKCRATMAKLPDKLQVKYQAEFDSIVALVNDTDPKPTAKISTINKGSASPSTVTDLPSKNVAHRVDHPVMWAISFEQLAAVHREAQMIYGSSYSEKTMVDINNDIITRVCRQSGKSYALTQNPDGLLADAFVTHCWSEPFEEFFNSLQRAFQTSFNKPNLWICAFALCQGDEQAIEEELSVPLDACPFVVALRGVKQFVVVRNSKVDLYSRIWCVCELVIAEECGFFSSRTAGMVVEVTGDHSKFEGEESSCLDAKSSNPKDKARVLRYLLEKEGGWTKIDALVHRLRNFS